MPTLILPRGLPGSGKTTLAKKLVAPFEVGLHIEADMFFINRETGKYEMDPDRLPEAHRWCLSEAARVLKEGKNVIVSNTFTTFRRMEDYFNLLSEADSCIVIECTGNFKSLHDPPEEVMDRMRANWHSNIKIAGEFVGWYPHLPLPSFFFDKEMEHHA